MRLRVFLIILTTLVVSAVGISSVLSFYFERERVELIDNQLTRARESLLASPDFRSALAENVNLENAVTTAIGSDRIGKIVIVADSNGRPIFQGSNRRFLQADLPTSPRRITVTTEHKFVRLLNTPLASGHTLQLGLVLDPNFVNWRILDGDARVVIGGVVLAMFGISIFLTIVVMAPVRLLNSHLDRATADLSNLRDVEPLPSQLLKFSSEIWSSSDEFASQVRTVDKLIDRINRNYKMTRSWTFQFAHELKTPLAILRAETQAKAKARSIPPDHAATILSEIDHINATITSFLSWAELESSGKQNLIHVTKVKSKVGELVRRYEATCGRQIDIDIGPDFSVAAGDGHFDQLVANILSNACRYTPGESAIRVTIGDHRLRIADEGPGIPTSVKDKIGQPFNVGPSSDGSGTGLGLAWVNTVAKAYGWDLRVETSPEGTAIEVSFPPLVESV